MEEDGMVEEMRVIKAAQAGVAVLLTYV